jgi:hypothetical protein
MTQMYIQHATVTGRGMFPLDMLRYDRCSPERETDSNDIQRSVQGEYFTWTVQVIRRVNLKTEAWTVDRWQSFGVSLAPQKDRDYKAVG